ncbi:MAG: hypothetical protein KU28_01055 [Sulfurovum sp. PC08-66]|nr:MAG: hypothetical protein KU28_01055 [Sulfurovum sp. PC08-66]KIM12545.1 MAG: hypothetical protein KU37_01170 [Sulfuricurvum sp. PC08-66]
MQLQETIDQLKSLGVNYIHDKTHISIYAIEAIIAQDFNALHPIQFAGFLNIIETTVRVNMNPLREALEQHKASRTLPEGDSRLFIYTPEEKESKKMLYAIVGAIVGLLFIIFLFSGDEESTPAPTESQTLLKVTEKIAQDNQPTELVTDTKVPQFDTQTVVEDALPKEEPFVLHPKSELWIGIIDLDTKVQKDTITTEPYILDENVNMLISLGHGQVDIKLHDELKEYTTPKRLRFLYRNGELRQITLGEFIELNDGKSW